MTVHVPSKKSCAVWWIECRCVPINVDLARLNNPLRLWWSGGEWVSTLVGAEVFYSEKGAQLAAVGATLCLPPGGYLWLMEGRRDVP